MTAANRLRAWAVSGYGLGEPSPRDVEEVLDECDELRRLLHAYGTHGAIATEREARIAAELQRTVALQKLARVRRALSRHPVCERIPEDDVLTCGWKAAVLDIQEALR